MPPPPTEEVEAAVPPPPEEGFLDEDDMPPPGDADGLGDQVPIPLPKLIPGRFVVEVLEAYGLSKHDAASAITATKIDPYLKATLGVQKKAPSYKGRVHKNQGKQVMFEEIMVFNMTNPEEFVAENDIKLCLTIMHSNILSDAVLGQAEISMLPLLLEFAKEIEFPLYYRKRKADPKERAGGVKLRVRFRPAKAGYLEVLCMEGRNMKNMELLGKQDPYCKFELHKQKPQRTKTIKNGGTACSFNEERVLLWIDTMTWTEDLNFSCWDEDVGADDLIGARAFDILDFVSDATTIEAFEREGTGRVQDEWFEIFQGKQRDKLSGEIRLRFEFFPAGTLTITSIEGRHLVDKDSMGKQDPFIVYMIGSDHGIGSHKVRTKTDQDGGTEPRWDEETVLPLVDHHQLTMEVYDEDRIGSNDLIGKASFSLLPVYRKGLIDTWVTLKNKDSWGRVTKCGEIHVRLDFRGPPGVGFPQLQPDMDVFDESERENLPKPEAEEGDAAPADDQPRGPELSDEFSDADIEAAFNFIDLNKNGYIGAGELRHILICMGELITDEEVDEMVRMVDGDGDGQVSYEEFYALMVHPDPGGSSFNVQQVLAKSNKAVVLGEDAKEIAERRAEDAARKKEKLHLMKLFASENEVKMEALRRAFDKFRIIDRGMGNTGKVDFPTMCDVLLVEPLGEYKKLFKLLDVQGEGRINMRELLLGLGNFSGAGREARCNFCFTLFDEDGNGTLNKEELTEIVKAIHLASDAKAVARKVDTILKQCDDDGSGTIDRSEFLVVAEKFPNLLMNSQAAAAAGAGLPP